MSFQHKTQLLQDPFRAQPSAVGSWFSSIFLAFLAIFSCRHHGADRLHRRAGSGVPRERLCHLGAQEFEVSADPAHDPHGPAGRHLEAPGFCGLRTQ